MFQLADVPTPPDSHYVGIIYWFEKDGVQHLLTVKDKDKYEGHINTKLPGGSNERIYEEYMPYENYLFKILDRLSFEKKALIKILKNERERKQIFEDYPENNEVGFVMRNMVIQSLNKIGYYPLDLEPRVAYFLEKRGHTQYFVEVKSLMDKQGNEIQTPGDEHSFKALDLDIRQTRVPISVKDYKNLILSHGTAIEKYLMFNDKG
ncbi:MAG: hypothetical protein AAF573_17950, partial [Bacteroidota bacterium]